jgi:hypothetical protein
MKTLDVLLKWKKTLKLGCDVERLVISTRRKQSSSMKKPLQQGEPMPIITHPIIFENVDERQYHQSLVTTIIGLSSLTLLSLSKSLMSLS